MVFIYLVVVCVCVYMNATQVWTPVEDRRRCRTPWSGVIGSCEISVMDVEEPAWVYSKSNRCF